MRGVVDATCRSLGLMPFEAHDVFQDSIEMLRSGSEGEAKGVLRIEGPTLDQYLIRLVPHGIEFFPGLASKSS